MKKIAVLLFCLMNGSLAIADEKNCNIVYFDMTIEGPTQKEGSLQNQHMRFAAENEMPTQASALQKTTYVIDIIPSKDPINDMETEEIIMGEVSSGVSFTLTPDICYQGDSDAVLVDMSLTINELTGFEVIGDGISRPNMNYMELKQPIQLTRGREITLPFGTGDYQLTLLAY